MLDTVLIYGTNKLTRSLIDWERQDCEFWSFNEVGSLKDETPEALAKILKDMPLEEHAPVSYWAKRVDALFQMHAAPIWRNKGNINHPAHYAWLQRPHEYPIYMQEHYEDVPSSVKYPFDEIVATLLPNLRRQTTGEPEAVQHFTSTAAYALALAIYKGFKRIEIAAIEMTSDTEYVRQRDGVTFWLGVAVGKGIDVVIHSPALMNEKRYGYTGEVVIQKQAFEMAVRTLQSEQERAKSVSFQTKGQSEALLDALLKTSSQKDADRLVKEFLQALNMTLDAAFDYGRMTGCLQENARYMQECDKLIEAAGGEKALAALMNVEPVP